MLVKLLKYEFKSTSRIMWILYAASIVCGALLGLVLRMETIFSGAQYDGLSITGTGDNRLLAILLFSLLAIYMLLLGAMMVMTYIMIIMRFYRNLLLGEGYLMHTLPVKPHKLILSKLLVAILWVIIALAAVILSAIVIGLTSGILPQALKGIPFHELMYGLSELFKRESGVPQLLLLAFFGGVSQILQFYFAMAIGNLANQNKLLFSVLAYIGISTVLSILQVILMVSSTDFFAGEAFFDSIIIRSLLLSVVSGIAYFFGTNYILKNRLNLA